MKSRILFSLVLAGATCLMRDGQAAIFHAGTAQELQTDLSLAAGNGEDDTILLAAGIYAGNFTFNTTEAQSLTIKTETNTLPGQVVLDGQQAGAVLNLNAGPTSVNMSLEGITLRNGKSSSQGGGLVITTGGTLNLLRCVLRDSGVISPNSYGNLAANANTITIADTVISGGYGYSGGGGVNAVEAIVLKQNEIWNNAGSLSLSARNITVTDNRVRDNPDGALSLSAYNYPSGGTCLLSNNIVQRNSANGSPFYVSVVEGPAIVVNNVFLQNSNRYYNPAYVAGVIAINGKSIIAQGNLLQGNHNGGMTIQGDGKVVVANNLVVSNFALPSLNGGGIYVISGATNWIVNNTLSGNSAQNGGGLYLDTSRSSTNYNYVHNNIMWGNIAVGNGGDAYVVSGGALRSLYNNNFHSMGGLWDVAVNNIDVAPLFVDQLRGDYHLRANSLCINTGNNAAPGLPLIDKDGNVRVGNGVVDIGCYEQDSTDKHPADANNNWVMTGQEFTNYAKAWTTNGAWSTGPNPISMDYVTRAGFLFQTNGGAYNNAGGGKPLNWKP